MEQAVHSVVLEPQVIDVIVTYTTDYLTFKVLSKIFVNEKAEKYFFRIAKMAIRYKEMIEEINKTKF